MLASYPKVHPATAFRTIGGEAIVITIPDAMQHHLNEVGTFIWERLVPGNLTVGEIVEGVCREFDVEPDVARRDVLVFVEELLARNLVVLDDRPGEGAVP